VVGNQDYKRALAHNFFQWPGNIRLLFFYIAGVYFPY
jgi:hypothetical protein